MSYEEEKMMDAIATAELEKQGRETVFECARRVVDEAQKIDTFLTALSESSALDFSTVESTCFSRSEEDDRFFTVSFYTHGNVGGDRWGKTVEKIAGEHGFELVDSDEHDDHRNFEFRIR